ncbi:MAG: S8 family serine peptidase, partial [archaeon]
LGFSGSGVRVAVLDSGIDSLHELLAGKVVLEKNFSQEQGTLDGLGHGTHVAGIVASTAPGAKLLNGKVLDSTGTGSVSLAIDAINWAVDPDGNAETNDGANVINISFGGTFSEIDSPINRAVAGAVESGVLVVSAAGNCSEAVALNCGGFVGVTSPGNSPYSLTVGAVDSQNNHADFSSGALIEGVGVKPDVVAPGVGISSSVPKNAYVSFSGTSMAAPFVSGVAALLLEANPHLSPLQMHQILGSNARDLGVEGKDKLFGFGLVDANASLGSFVFPSTFTSFSSSHIITSLNEPVSSRIRLSNFSLAPIALGEVLSDSWIETSLESHSVPANGTVFLNYSIDPKNLGVGDFEGKIVVKAENGATLSHSVFLKVSENGEQQIDQNVLMEISRPSIIYVNGQINQGVKVLRNSTIEIKVQAVNPLGPSRNYAMSAQVNNPGGSLVCDLSYQTYFEQANFGKQLFFNYLIPSGAPSGVFSVTANSFYECTGTPYNNGACINSSSYSCPDEIQNNTVVSSNAFTVVDSCSSGACCNTGTGIPRDATEVCSPNISTEYTCNNGDVYRRDLSQYCPGVLPACSGEQKWGSWHLTDDCASNETCVQRGTNATCETGAPIACTGDFDCPGDGYLPGMQCSANNAVKTYRDYFCDLPGTTGSSCRFNDRTEQQFSCQANQSCVAGVCVTQTLSNNCTAGEKECDGEFLKTCEYNAAGSAYRWSDSACLGLCIDSGTLDYCQQNDTTL